MKKLFVLLLVGSLFGLMTGCDLDDDGVYSLDKVWVGFGLVDKGAASGLYTIKMDDGEVLYPVTNSRFDNEVFDKERVLVNFTILGNKDNPDHNEYYYVKINSLRKILYKGIFDITPAKEDSIGKDPIYVQDKWIKNNMLNFELRYWGGYKTHFINLVKQPGAINTANGPVVLELRHNNNNDSDDFPLSAFVSFDLSALKVAGKNSTPFKIIAKGFDGKDFEYTGEYKY
jgi:hypothetical protein